MWTWDPSDSNGVKEHRDRVGKWYQCQYMINTALSSDTRDCRCWNMEHIIKCWWTQQVRQHLWSNVDTHLLRLHTFFRLGERERGRDGEREMRQKEGDWEWVPWTLWSRAEQAQGGGLLSFCPSLPPVPHRVEWKWPAQNKCQVNTVESKGCRKNQRGLGLTQDDGGDVASATALRYVKRGP